MKDNNESYTKEWVNLNLMINKETGDINIISGDQDPGEGDTGYIGHRILKEKRNIKLF